MKSKIRKPILVLAAMVAVQAVPFVAKAGPAIAKTYRATCRDDAPLNSFEGCSADTDAGAAAQDCALNEAIVQCQEDYNADCVFGGTSFREIVSSEFIGYKACEATVRVHGYRLSN